MVIQNRADWDPSSPAHGGLGCDSISAGLRNLLVVDTECRSTPSFVGLRAGRTAVAGTVRHSCTLEVSERAVATKPPTSPGTRPLVHGSTDVGDVSWVTPTVQLTGSNWAIGTPIHSWQAVAQGKLPAAHKGMVYAAKVIAATAIELCTDPDLMKSARHEFEMMVTETPYDCPIPDGVVAPPARTGQTAGDTETK